MKDLKSIIEEKNIEFVETFPMNKYTTLKVGGEAKIVVYPSSHKELIELLDTLYNLDEEFVVLGAGSNTIIKDKGISKVIVSTKKLRHFTFDKASGIVIADCGALLSTIMHQTTKAGFSGFEFAAGIPGTIGGGIYMNAGANGGEIKDVIDKIWVWDHGRLDQYYRDEIKFEYRKTHLPPNSVVTRASFKLKKADPTHLEKKIKSYLKKRNETQPVNQANTGSIFKNPPQIPAGKLIEELGLKGYKQGEAMFSSLHANFIVNTGNAKAADVIKLIELASKYAYEKKRINLETEVIIMGDE